MEVLNITLKDIPQAAYTLFRAFEYDPLMMWIFGNKQAYENKGLELFKTWVKYCVLYGTAIRTSNFESVAIRKKPGDTKLRLWRILRSGMYNNPKILGEAGFKRLMEFDKLTSKERTNHLGKQPFWYCWMTGTKPEFQRKGYGQTLAEYTFTLAKECHFPCYLETSNKNSVQVHLRNRYELVSEPSSRASRIDPLCRGRCYTSRFTVIHFKRQKVHKI